VPGPLNAACLLAFVPVCILSPAQPLAAEGQLPPVLAYHHVVRTEAELEPNAPVVTADLFEEHLRHLQENRIRTLSMAEYLEAIDLPDPPRDAVLLTIDDGYESVYTIAYPLLQQYGMRATAFVLTSRVGETNVVNPHQPWLTWEQCREMEASGHVDIEAHGDRSHVSVQGLRDGRAGSGPFFLTRLLDPTTGAVETDGVYRARILGDLRACKRKIDEALGKNVVAFCWPLGKASAECAAAAKEAGYSVTFTLGVPDPPEGARDRFRSPEAWQMVTAMLQPGPEPQAEEEPPVVQEEPQVLPSPEPPSVKPPPADRGTQEPEPVWIWYAILGLAFVAVVLGFVVLYIRTVRPVRRR
jgi:peptidoglycan/xylan/chitin deacetylase (PgdA/CDA1 family)